MEVFHAPAAAESPLKSFIPLGREFSIPAALPSVVSHLTWPALSAKPRLGLVLITHFFFFNRKCLHFQLSVGGWRADKLWMETQNRFLLHPHLHFDQRKSEDLRRPRLPSERRKDDSAMGIPKRWAFPSALPSCCSEALGRVGWFRLVKCLLLLRWYIYDLNLSPFKGFN